jgi:16S rRNA processing protein RimM
MFEDYFYLGKITKRFGLKGELVVYLDTDEPEKYHKLESVFFDMDGEPIPFFVEEIKIKAKNQLIVLFQGVDDKSSAHYVDTDLYLPLSALPVLEGNKFYYHEIKGFTIVDATHGNIGICENVLEYSPQAVMQIVHPKGEILLPIVDHFIKNVHREKRTIEVETPPGLVEFYVDFV